MDIDLDDSGDSTAVVSSSSASMPLKSSCANCSYRLSVDSCIASYSSPTSTLSVYQGLELIFKCREVTAEEAMPNLLKFCATCGHLFGEILKFYQAFVNATSTKSYVRNLVYGLSSGGEASLVKVELAESEGDSNQDLSTHDPDLDEILDYDHDHNSHSIVTGEKDKNQEVSAASLQLDNQSEDPNSSVPESVTTSSGVNRRKREYTPRQLRQRPVRAKLMPEKKILSKPKLPPKTYQCKDCDEVFPTMGERKSHIAEIHLTGVKVKAKTKVKVKSKRKAPSRKKKQYVSSSSETEDEEVTAKTYKCSFCEKEYPKQFLLTMHEATHTGLRPFHCTESDCEYNYRKSGDLRRHIKRAHPSKHVPKIIDRHITVLTPEDEVLLATTEYKCISAECTGISYPTFKEWVLHQHSTHGVQSGYNLDSTEELKPLQGKTRPCPHCGKTALHNLPMLRHIRSAHLGMREFSCTICSKPFTTKLGLKLHNDSFHDPNASKFLCVLCGTSFHQRHYLKIHEEIHSGQLSKSFDCETCGAKFRHRHELKSHKGVHLGLTFPCDLCGKEYQSEYRRKEHKKRQHLRKRVRDKICELCGKAYAFNQHLREHLMNTHKLSDADARAVGKLKPPPLRSPKLVNKPKTCEYCGRKYARREQLFIHLMSVHGKSEEEAKRITGLETKRQLISDGKSCHLKRLAGSTNDKELPSTSSSAHAPIPVLPPPVEIGHRSTALAEPPHFNQFHHDLSFPYKNFQSFHHS